MLPKLPNYFIWAWVISSISAERFSTRFLNFHDPMFILLLLITWYDRQDQTQEQLPSWNNMRMQTAVWSFLLQQLLLRFTNFLNEYGRSQWYPCFHSWPFPDPECILLMFRKPEQEVTSHRRRHTHTPLWVISHYICMFKNDIDFTNRSVM